MKNDPITKEVYEVLSKDSEKIPYESVTSEQNSPLNQAVKEQHGQQDEKDTNWNLWKPQGNDIEKEEPPKIVDSSPIDAPEQVFGSQEQERMHQDASDQKTETVATDTIFELPTPTAKQAANTILGMSNNVLAVGGGFFIKIRKHKDFYEFQEIVELIDTQNEKNIQRIQLDPDDKALLKPLLVAILKKKAKNLTPEQQLMGAILSILIKKAQVVMEVRAENDILVDRILDIVREERGDTPEQSPKEDVEIKEEAPQMDFAKMQVDTQQVLTKEQQPQTQETPKQEVLTETYDEDLYTSVVEVYDANQNSEDNDQKK